MELIFDHAFFLFLTFTSSVLGSLEMIGFALNNATSKKCILYDHRPYQLSEDDYIRVCQIPKRKVR